LGNILIDRFHPIAVVHAVTARSGLLLHGGAIKIDANQVRFCANNLHFARIIQPVPGLARSVQSRGCYGNIVIVNMADESL
jgi:hypothetical protein